MGRTRPTKRPGLSVREYAAHRKSAGLIGGTKNAVQKALRDGRIQYVAGDPTKGIDPDLADAAWEAATNPARVHPAAHEAARESLEGRVENGLPMSMEGVPDYQLSRARREHYEAELRRLDLGERLGYLVQTKVVSEQLQAMAGMVRQRLLTLAPKMAPLLAAVALENAEEPDLAPVQVELTLAEEVRTILEALRDDPTGAKARQELEERRQAEEDADR